MRGVQTVVDVQMWKGNQSPSDSSATCVFVLKMNLLQQLISRWTRTRFFSYIKPGPTREHGSLFLFLSSAEKEESLLLPSRWIQQRGEEFRPDPPLSLTKIHNVWLGYCTCCRLTGFRGGLVHKEIHTVNTKKSNSEIQKLSWHMTAITFFQKIILNSGQNSGGMPLRSPLGGNAIHTALAPVKKWKADLECHYSYTGRVARGKKELG